MNMLLRFTYWLYGGMIFNTTTAGTKIFAIEILTFEVAVDTAQPVSALRLKYA